MSSGGRRDSYRRPDDLLSIAGSNSDEKFSATEVADYLQDALREINDHDYEAIDKHRTEIQNKLDAEFEDVEVIRFGGSHARHTDVSSLSDVDVLVPFGDADDRPTSSNAALATLASVLRDRFPRTDIHVGKMAVTIRFSDGTEVQVLPAYRVGDGYLIADPNSKGWIPTHPTRFARQLTRVNKQNANNVVPMIKLAKYLCAAQGIEAKSYHLENMAVRAFERYTASRTLPHMLKHFFNQAKAYVLQKMPDPGGQSSDVSNYLTPDGRVQLAKQFQRVERQLDRAMRSSSIEPWQTLFEKR